MDDNPIDANSLVVDSKGGNPGMTPSNWTGLHTAAIAPRGSGAFLFVGWHDIVNGKQVDPAASSFTIPSSDAYNPDAYKFQVSISVNADDPISAVQAGYMVADDTLNIIQKGLAGPTAQQWKLSVTVSGKFLCSFRGPDTNGTDTLFVATTTAYAWGVTRRITCSWDPTTHLITAMVATARVTETYTAPGPVSVANPDSVTVGKKPGSTYPGDTFAGRLDNLVISKGQ